MKNLKYKFNDLIDIQNRIPNLNYNYDFEKNVSFESRYNNGFNNLDYKIYTNNLGFRDYSVRKLSEKKLYSIVIGDSFVEGTGLNYNDTLVAKLNNKLNPEKSKIQLMEALVDWKREDFEDFANIYPDQYPEIGIKYH